MKRRLVKGLVRLYPSRWRAEYGDELAEVLLRRPLGVRDALNVLANALRQQLRTQECWLIVAAPLLLWMLAYLALAFLAPKSAAPLAGKPTILGVAIFFGVGFATVWRTGAGGGRAAMKLSIVLTLPIFLIAFLTLVGLAPAPPLRAMVGNGRWDLLLLIEAPILQIPYAGLLGWAGGNLARIVRKRFRPV